MSRCCVRDTTKKGGYPPHPSHSPIHPPNLREGRGQDIKSQVGARLRRKLSRRLNTGRFAQRASQVPSLLPKKSFQCFSRPLVTASARVARVLSVANPSKLSPNWGLILLLRFCPIQRFENSAAKSKAQRVRT
jgi:hypothetical protein